MAEFPALPLFTDSYLADTEHLSDAEHGLYLRILILMWRSPDCRIPNDDAWIARRLRKAEDAMRTHVRPLLCEFCQTDGNWLFQKRLRREFEWVKKNRSRMADLANKRWGNDNPSSVGNAGDAKHPTLPHQSKKEGASRPLKNGHSGKEEGAETVSYPDEQKRAEILARKGMGSVYSEAELKKQAEAIKKGIPCPTASPARIAVMIAKAMITEDEARAVGATW